MGKPKKRRDYTTVSVPNSLMQKVDEAVKSGEHGYQNRSDLILEAIRKRLRELGILETEIMRAPLEHFNLNEYGVQIVDRQLNSIIQVDFKPDKVFCEYDESSDCRHVKFALELPEVQKILHKKGWKIS